MSNLVPTVSALDRLKNRATKRSSLDDLVNARTKRSILAVDVSSSMAMHTAAGERKIDKLRKVVDKLRTTHPVPMMAFGLSRDHGYGVDLLPDGVIPEPQGMTPLAKAIDFAKMQEANHLIVVTDGCPDSRDAAFTAAERFANPIDVFYIGDGNDAGAAFCRELAKRTKGSSDVTDLTGDVKQLAGKIIGLLGDGGL